MSRRQRGHRYPREDSNGGNGGQDGRMYTRIGRLEENVQSLGAEVERLIYTVDRLASRMTDQLRTPWGVIAAWSAVILAIGGIVGGVYYRDLARLEASSSKQWEEIGGLKMLAQRNELSAGFAKDKVLDLDAVLQREMDLKDDNTRNMIDSKTDALDRRIQTEIITAQQATDKLRSEQFKALEQRLRLLERGIRIGADPTEEREQ